jgi:hypothetical protein
MFSTQRFHYSYMLYRSLLVFRSAAAKATLVQLTYTSRFASRAVSRLVKGCCVTVAHPHGQKICLENFKLNTRLEFSLLGFQLRKNYLYGICERSWRIA